MTSVWLWWYWAARKNTSPSRGTNRPNGGLVTQPPRGTSFARVLVPGTGERRDETKKRTFNTPAPPLTQHHCAKRTTTNNGTRRRRFCPAAGRSALRHDRNTQQFMRASADRRPPAALIAASLSSVVR